MTECYEAIHSNSPIAMRSNCVRSEGISSINFLVKGEKERSDNEVKHKKHFIDNSNIPKNQFPLPAPSLSWKIMIANARLLKRSLVCLRLTQALARLPAKAGYSKCARALPTGSLFSAATPAFAFGSKKQITTILFMNKCWHTFLHAEAYPKHTLVS